MVMIRDSEKNLHSDKKNKGNFFRPLYFACWHVQAIMLCWPDDGIFTFRTTRCTYRHKESFVIVLKFKSVNIIVRQILILHKFVPVNCASTENVREHDNGRSN